jgi:hypothetical protein
MRKLSWHLAQAKKSASNKIYSKEWIEEQGLNFMIIRLNFSFW